MIQLAIQTAVEHHEGQKRKGTNIPYIVHPIEVGIILTENGANEEVITAGILHDTLEDTKLTYDAIKSRFKERIAKLVISATETNRNVEGITWKQRKEHTVNSIREASFDSCLIICADKLSNMRSIKKDYNEIGNELWKRFNAGYEEQKWYYHSLVVNLSNSDISHLKVFEEFNSIVKDVFGEIPSSMYI